MLKPLIKAGSTQRENAASLCEEQFHALLVKLLGAHLLWGQRWQGKGRKNVMEQRSAEASWRLEVRKSHYKCQMCLWSSCWSPGVLTKVLLSHLCSCPSLAMLENRSGTKGADAPQLRIRETFLIKSQQDIIIRVSPPRLSFLCPGQGHVLGI